MFVSSILACSKIPNGAAPSSSLPLLESSKSLVGYDLSSINLAGADYTNSLFGKLSGAVAGGCSGAG